MGPDRWRIELLNGRSFYLWLEWEPRDFWVGLFVRKKEVHYSPESGRVAYQSVWLCLLPCLPLHLRWWRPARNDE